MPNNRNPQPAHGSYNQPGSFAPSQGASGMPGSGQPATSISANILLSTPGTIGMPGFSPAQAGTGTLAGPFGPASSAGWRNQPPAALNPRAQEPLSRGRARQKTQKKRRATLVSVLLICCVCLLFLAGAGYRVFQNSRQPSPTPRATQVTIAPTATATPSPTPSPTPRPVPTATAVPALSPVPATVSGLPYLIMVSLSEQRMTAYDHGQPVLTTLVTTGIPRLYTPPGTYHISQRVPNSWFTSPWPKSSPNYYPPMYVYYGLRLNTTQLYIHDATWRTVFGPDVTPAQRSHGCVETPLANMKWLYNWTPLGTTVVVVW